VIGPPDSESTVVTVDDKSVYVDDHIAEELMSRISRDLGGYIAEDSHYGYT
jgi:hypothetical protein